MEKLLSSEIKCRNSKVQEYQCQVCVKTPWKSSKEWICFDACLVKELFLLWDKGIITNGCCCGKHLNNKKDVSYIGVYPEYIGKMKKLGYKVRINSTDKTIENIFIPKTNFNNWI